MLCWLCWTISWRLFQMFSMRAGLYLGFQSSYIHSMVHGERHFGSKSHIASTSGKRPTLQGLLQLTCFSGSCFQGGNYLWPTKPHLARAFPVFLKYGAGTILGNSAQKSHKWCLKKPHMASELLNEYRCSDTCSQLGCFCAFRSRSCNIVQALYIHWQYQICPSAIMWKNWDDCTEPPGGWIGYTLN